MNDGKIILSIKVSEYIVQAQSIINQFITTLLLIKKKKTQPCTHRREPGTHCPERGARRHSPPSPRLPFGRGWVGGTLGLCHGCQRAGDSGSSLHCFVKPLWSPAGVPSACSRPCRHPSHPVPPRWLCPAARCPPALAEQQSRGCKSHTSAPAGPKPPPAPLRAPGGWGAPARPTGRDENKPIPDMPGLEKNTH